MDEQHAAKIHEIDPTKVPYVPPPPLTESFIEKHYSDTHNYQAKRENYINDKS